MDERQQHFEQMYRADPDPWGFRTAWYEQRKYAITMASLPRQHYRAVWEPACSIGELTALLCSRADQVDASDVSPTALVAARHRLAGHDNVGLRHSPLPAPAPGPPGSHDLIVLSEILYYLSPTDREDSLLAAEQAVAGDGDLVVVHWRYHPQDAFAAGADVNDAVRARDGWQSLVRHDEADFVLDVLTRP